MDSSTMRLSKSAKKILQKSIVLFCQQGYHQTSMSHIAEACGLSKATIYCHFNSKEDLIKKAIQMIEAELEQGFISQLNNGCDLTCNELAKLFEDYIYFQQNTNEGKLLSRLATEFSSIENGISNLIARHYKRWYRVLLSTFLKSFDERKSRQLARAVLSQTLGDGFLQSIIEEPEFYKTKRYILDVVSLHDKYC